MLYIEKMSPVKTDNAADRNEAQTKETNQRLLQLAAFNEIGKALTSSLDLREILKIVMVKVSELMHPKNWSLLLLDEGTNELRFEIIVGPGSEKLKDFRLKVGEGVAGWVAKEGVPLLVPDVSKDPRFCEKADKLTEFRTKSIICVPLSARGKCLGVIELINKVGEGAGFNEEDLLMITTVADYTAIAIENAYFFNKVQELTITDDLTKLYNSRFLHTRLEYEIERAKRFNYDLSIIFLDLDFFKEVNDSYGHMRGSKLLKEIGDLISSMTRNVDMACRYGGDEFIVVMPGTSKKNAAVVAQKIRDAMREGVFLQDEGLSIHMTGSFGVASYPDDARDKDELIHLADHAMYRIKNLKKDGVAEA